MLPREASKLKCDLADFSPMLQERTMQHDPNHLPEHPSGAASLIGTVAISVAPPFTVRQARAGNIDIAGGIAVLQVD